MAWHVLEHLPAPDKTMQRLTSWLRPGGIFVGAVPNACSLQSKLFRRHWQWLSPPAHLHYFCPNTLDAFIEVIGLKSIAIQTQRGDAENALIVLLSLLLHGMNQWIRRTPRSIADDLKTRDRTNSDGLPTGTRLTRIRRILGIARGSTEILASACRPLTWVVNHMGGGEEILFAAIKSAPSPIRLR